MSDFGENKSLFNVDMDILSGLVDEHLKIVSNNYEYKDNIIPDLLLALIYHNEITRRNIADQLDNISAEM